MAYAPIPASPAAAVAAREATRARTPGVGAERNLRRRTGRTEATELRGVSNDLERRMLRSGPPLAAAPRRSRARAPREVDRRRRRTRWRSTFAPPVAGGRTTTTARLTAGFSAYAQPGFSGHGGAYGGAYGVLTGRYGGPRARRRPPAAVEAGRAMSAQNAIAARAGRDAAFATVYRF